VTEHWGTRCARLIPGSPVPLARSRTRMSGDGREYSIKASVTALPSTADFAFHFSAATRRKEEPHGAGFEADTSGLLTCLLGHTGNGFACYGFRGRGFGYHCPPRLRFRHQFRWLQPLGRLPQAFQVVELAGFLGENMDGEVHIVEQHPLSLFVALSVRYAHAQCLQALVPRVGNRLDLPRITSAAHHKVVSEGSRIFFQFENRHIVSLFVLTGEDGFTHLEFEVVLFRHIGLIDCNPPRSSVVACPRLSSRDPPPPT